MQTSQGYIFCILQHFITKFCNFTYFNKFFTGIYFFLAKSKISLTCKLSIIVMELIGSGDGVVTAGYGVGQKFLCLMDDGCGNTFCGDSNG